MGLKRISMTVNHRALLTLVLVAIVVTTVYIKRPIDSIGKVSLVSRLTCPPLPRHIVPSASLELDDNNAASSTLHTMGISHKGLLTQEREDVARRLAQASLDNNKGETSNNAFNDFLHYLLLLDDNCTSLVIPEAVALMQTDYFREKVERHSKHLANFTVIEGFSAQVAGQAAFYAMLARQPWVRQVCEIGFNAGHSALYWLAASNTTRLLSFDLGEYPFSLPMANLILNMFPDRFSVVWGDSTKTVPEFIRQSTDGWTSAFSFPACDVIVVDGGHAYDVAFADLCNMRAFASTARHVLIFDDTPCDGDWCQGPTRSWRELRGVIKPLFQCLNYEPQATGFERGFSVGYYTFSD